MTRLGSVSFKHVPIQTGEEGRYRLASPELGSVRSIETFMVEAQAHLSEVYGEPVPRCPLHVHALVAEVGGSENAWVVLTARAAVASGSTRS